MASRSTDAKDAASHLDVPLLLVLPPQHLVADEAVDLCVLNCVYSLALGPGVLENLFSPPRVPGKSCEFLVGGRLALALADGEVEEVQHGAARVPPWCSSLGNRSGNRSCGSVREKANCGLQEHAHGLPESPVSPRRLPNAAGRASPRLRVFGKASANLARPPSTRRPRGLDDGYAAGPWRVAILLEGQWCSASERRDVFGVPARAIFGACTPRGSPCAP